jgi:acetyl-CoA carboxylase biotin carboxyl carrier protein
MKTKEIQELLGFIDKSGLDEVNIETENMKLNVKKNAEVAPVTINTTEGQSVATDQLNNGQLSHQPVDATPQSIQSPSSQAESDADRYVTVKSPMIGTFYRSSNPNSNPFVHIGDHITKGQTVCIVEAMKLFNEIEADVTGTIIKILIDDASPVEFDQPLFLVDPS